MNIYRECPACSSINHEVLNYGIKKCVDCGAIYGKTDISVAAQYINTNKMIPNSSDQFYFDFTINGQRMHGWADCDSKAVTQWG